jgi:hypothetical protein
VTLLGQLSAPPVSDPGAAAYMMLYASATRRGRAGAGRTQEGDEVELFDLVGAAELNGREGVCGAFDAVKGRYEVAMMGGGAPPVSVKPENVRARGGGGAAAALLKRCDVCGEGGDGLQLCGRCKAATYCGRECQAAAWPAHKGVCNPKRPEAKRTLFWAAREGAPPIEGLIKRGEGVGAAKSARAWDLDVLGEGTTLLKIQRPMDAPWGAAAGAPRGLLVYDQRRRFTAMVEPGEEPAHSTLLQLMGAELKVFVLATKAAGEQRGLDVTLRKEAPPGW